MATETKQSIALFIAAFVIALLLIWALGWPPDDELAKVKADRDRIIEANRRQDAEYRATISDLTRRYNQDITRATDQEADLLGQIETLRRVRPSSKTERVELSGNSEQLDDGNQLVQNLQHLPWAPQYPVFLDAVENYIQENLSIRSEISRLISEYEGILALKDQTIRELIENGDKMAATKAKRFGWTIGPTGGIAPSGKPFLGLGLTWGVRL